MRTIKHLAFQSILHLKLCANAGSRHMCSRKLHPCSVSALFFPVKLWLNESFWTLLNQSWAVSYPLAHKRLSMWASVVALSAILLSVSLVSLTKVPWHRLCLHVSLNRSTQHRKYNAVPGELPSKFTTIIPSSSIRNLSIILMTSWLSKTTLQKLLDLAGLHCTTSERLGPALHRMQHKYLTRPLSFLDWTTAMLF